MSVSKEMKIPRESDAWFEEHLEKLRNDKHWMEVPGVEYASTPDETVFFDELSDREQFNDRYIENRVRLGSLRSIAKLALGSFFLVFIVMVVFIIEHGSLYEDGGWGLALIAVIYGFFSWLCLKKSSRPIIRFNRQAQLVHIVLSPRFKVVSIPWREVKPFIHFQRDFWGSYNLMLLFPYRTPKSGNKTRDFPLNVTGGFCSSDWPTAHSATMRFEFIRLYMEKGLDAIPIHEEACKEGALTKPSGESRKDDPDFNKDPISYIWRVWLYRILVFPWLVDRILDMREASFRWPEEVEKLCEESADLSGIDTRVVPARTDRYYYVRPEGAPLFGTREYLRDYRIAELRALGLDPDGNPIPGFAEEQARLREQALAEEQAKRQAEWDARQQSRAARRGQDVPPDSTEKPRGGASWTPPKK